MLIASDVIAGFVSFCILKPRKSTQMSASMGDTALQGAPPNLLILVVGWSWPLVGLKVTVFSLLLMFLFLLSLTLTFAGEGALSQSGNSN